MHCGGLQKNYKKSGIKKRGFQAQNTLFHIFKQPLVSNYTSSAIFSYKTFQLELIDFSI